MDLYNTKKADYYNGRLQLQASQDPPQPFRRSFSMEMRVEPFIQPIFDKYLAGEDDEYLHLPSAILRLDSFNANVNSGIKKICTDMGITDKDKKYSGYNVPSYHGYHSPERL